MLSLIVPFPTLAAVTFVLIVLLLIVAVTYYRSRLKGPRKHLVGIAAVGAIVLIGVTVGAAFELKSLESEDSGSEELSWEAVSWRMHLFIRKAEGGIPDLSWRELWFMARTRGGFNLQAFVRRSLSVEGAIENPYVTNDDRQSGARIFRERCAVCHGKDGAGGHAPPLNRSGLGHGDSDLTVYKITRDGIAQTGMAPIAMSSPERWRLIGYLKTLQLANSGRDTDQLPPVEIQVSGKQLLAAGTVPDQWLTYSGSLDGQRYAPLTEITPANVSKLRLQWIHQFDTTESRSEATPIVVNGIIFTTEPPADVVALDAATGNVRWRYRRSLLDKLPTCCFRANRGLAVLGNTLFLGSLDGFLVAIDADTGTMIWQTSVVNPADGYTMTGAPLIVNGSVVVGVAGGEYGIRGFLAAYNPETGEQKWKFDTIPGPGEFGHESWKNDAWRTGGGPTWVTGSYDPSLDLVYWGVGNPAPDFQGAVRPGDNLFTDSVVALHAGTGKLAWYFQFTPHDEHDWDATQTPILAELPIKGVLRKVICWANRNGFYYVLDRATGAFLLGVPFVEQNWTKGLDAAGRPILSSDAEVSSAGRLTRPGVGGGTNWQNPAFDHKNGLIFIPATEGASVYTKSGEPKRGDLGFYAGSAGVAAEPDAPVVRALDAATGARKWDLSWPNSAKPAANGYSGLLATAGGLVFGASRGFVFGIDSATGREGWRVFLGGDTLAPPISYMVNGRQMILVSVGRTLLQFGL
jgi:alcohol dehydrogenase (cytochrome c)